MNCFVTGATGLVGSAVVDALLADGHQVTALTSRPDRLVSLARANVTAICGDMRDERVWRAQLQRCDAIVHAAQLPHGIRISDRAARKIGQADADAVRLLMHNAPRHCSAFIYTSGAWIYGDCNGPACTEDASLKPYPIAAYRVTVEKMVVEAAHSPRCLPSMVFRLGSVYGNAGMFRKLNVARLLRGRRIVVPGSGWNLISVVHHHDVARAYLRALKSPAAGEIFNLADREPVSVAEFTRHLAAVLGGRPPRHVPEWILRAATGSYVAAPVLGNTVIDSTKVYRVLGFEPAYPTYRDGIAALAQSVKRTAFG